MRWRVEKGDVLGWNLSTVKGIDHAHKLGENQADTFIQKLALKKLHSLQITMTYQMTKFVYHTKNQ